MSVCVYFYKCRCQIYNRKTRLVMNSWACLSWLHYVAKYQEQDDTHPDFVDRKHLRLLVLLEMRWYVSWYLIQSICHIYLWNMISAAMCWDHLGQVNVRGTNCPPWSVWSCATLLDCIYFGNKWRVNENEPLPGALTSKDLFLILFSCIYYMFFFPSELGWSHPCDVWSIGCILFEYYLGFTLFQV